MKVISDRITRNELKKMAETRFGHFVKAVVDVDQEIMAVDADLHADQEAELLSRGSRQAHLWGINLYPEQEGEDFIEIDSMINLKPSQGNNSRGVEDKHTREKVKKVVAKLVDR